MDQNLRQLEKRWLLEEKYKGIESQEYLQDLGLLVSGHPVDYLIGLREFLGCHIDLSFKPLIPRNETEFWLKELLDNTPNTQLKILDIFSGSGCIGIACLQHLSHCTVDFAEKNPKFVQQIQKNLDINNINPDRYIVYESDVFDSLSDGMQYDLILANPPYIAHNRRNTVQDSVHEHEDHNSLYADDDGLHFVKLLIDNAQKYLKKNGSLYIEYDPWQTNAIVTYIKTTHPAISYDILRDQFDQNRVVKINLS